jgi:hypothetical protein
MAVEGLALPAPKVTDALERATTRIDLETISRVQHELLMKQVLVRPLCGSHTAM